MLYYNRIRVGLIILCALLICSTAAGCTGQYLDTSKGIPDINADEERIDEENMSAIVKELSSEKYMGRLTGTKGNELAAEYISDYFSKVGLENPKGTDKYKQYYEQPVAFFNSKPSFQLLSSEGKVYSDYSYPEDFTVRLPSSSSSTIDLKASLYLVDELGEISPENKNIDGKLLLIPFRMFISLSYEILSEYINKTGAAGAIIECSIRNQNRMYDALPVPPMVYPWSEGTEYKPIFDVRDGAFKQLVRVAEENQSVAVKCSYTLDDHYKVPNIVGCIPGSEGKPESGQIILGAHFDAMGDNKDGTYNSGSLDNASGTAAIMEIARLLKENKVPPKKTIVFVAFNGEEQYLKGSHYYAGNPVLPLNNSVLINLDMIGSTRKAPLTVSAEGGKNTELLKWFCSTAREMKLDTLPMAGGLCDGMSFAEKGVPAVSLVNLTRRGGYHTPNDNEYDVDKLRMEQYVKLILRYIDEYAY